MKRIIFLAMAWGLSFSGTALALPLDGLVAYYPFSGNATDASGRGNHGSVYGATLTEDRFGNPDYAYRFYGTGEHIEVLHTPDLNFGTGDFSVSFWVNTSDSAQLQSGFSKGMGETSDPGQYWMRINDYKSGGELSFYTRETSDPGTKLVTSEASVTDGYWHHIVSIRSGSDLLLYLDGEFLDSVTGTVRNVDSNDPLYIGAFLDSSDNIEKVLVGVIDDMSIYNRALTQAEISDLYTAPNPIPEPATILLIGTGLVGFAIPRIRKKFKKESTFNGTMSDM